MKFSTCLVSVLVLSTATFGSVLASHAQKDSPAPVSQGSPAMPPTTPPSAAPEPAPAMPSTPPSAAPEPAPATPSTPPATETPPASTSAPVTPDSPSTSGPAPSGGGSMAPTSSASGTSSTVLAMCGKNGASFLVDAEQAPVGCTESKINRPPAAALK
jgi:hypothetical protein